jgi:hypothetical protein
MKAAWCAVALMCAAGCGSGIGPHNPKVTPVASVDPPPKTAPAMVLRQRLQGDDPVQKAHAMVDLMAASITDDLIGDGVPAQRLYPGEPRPTQGWLVRGVVTELDEGNQLRRAMVGFGAGASELSLWVGVTDLARNPDAPFYTLDTSDSSGKMPGAIVKLNPYVAAAKFVMSRHSSERDVKKTASAIAKAIATEAKKRAP